MRTRTWCCHWLLGSVIAAGCMLGYAAQAAGKAGQAADDEALIEIIVTAEKREEKLQDVPVAMTVVGSQQIADEHVYTLADLSQTTPALEMIQTFGGPGGGGQIRGIGTQSFTRSAEGSVGVVVDGVSQGNLNISDLFDLQHIEVLEGPQGTLFGLTSSAGVINILTNAPDFSKVESIWHADYAHKGTAGSKFGQETLHGMVNVPLSADSALRISGSLDDYKGVQHNNYNGKDDVGDNYALRARYLWRPSDQLALSVIADVQRTVQHDGASGGSIASFNYVYANPVLTSELAACGITPGFANQDRCATYPQEARDTNYGLSVQIDYDLGSSILTSISAFRRDKTGPNSQDIQAVPQEIPQFTDTGVLTSGRQFSEELRLGSLPGAQLEYTAGLYYQNFLTDRNDGFFHILIPLPPPAPPLDVGGPDPFTETRTKSSAAFGQATYHVTSQFAVIAGLRYTYETISDYSSPRDLPPNNPGPSASGLIEHNLSGKLGLQYKFTPDWTGYVTVTKGYKGPQAQAATATTPAVLVPAEIPLSFELGIKGSTLQNRLSVDLALFDTKDHNYQGQSCGVTPFGDLECLPNSVDVTTKGIELNVYGRPLPHWTLTGGYIYDDAVYPSTYRGEDPNNLTGAGATLSLGGRQVIGVPRDKLTFSSDYTVPLGAVSGLAGADAVYKSQVLEGASPDPRFSYPGHWIVGARIGVRSNDERWGVSLFGRNINNSHEPLTLFGGPAFIPPGVVPFAPRGAVSGVSGWIGPQSLREVGLSADLKF